MASTSVATRVTRTGSGWPSCVVKSVSSASAWPMPPATGPDTGGDRSKGLGLRVRRLRLGRSRRDGQSAIVSRTADAFAVSVSTVTRRVPIRSRAP